ncbi:sensor histidine kinase [Bordetella genomosp. 4]|uniref:sensor histidine kinase n=1 Tax=Bordetella genomosp. 4 TaxID=463044 RepID=UPI000B9EB52C|nr:ATP-binding protein [Bordetella genomosp. 4]OZI44244.1 two-component sensor histidine kinase [Bordetella genomosp. 4]
MRWRRTSKGSPADSPRGYSLRRRLISTTLGSSIAVGVISTVIVLALAWKEVSDTFDDTLEEGARLVLALGEGISAGGLPARSRDDDAQPALRLDYQIISREGVVIRRGEDAPKRPFVDPGKRDDRFYDVKASGKRWRVYIRKHDSLGFSVQIGQEWEDRTDLIVDMLESLAWPLIGLWLLLGLVNWWLIRRLVAPLERMAREMETKSPADLSALMYDGNAREVRTVVVALNRLLSRLAQALEGERRFTADAAHELRTPLAALASRIQVMQRRLSTEGAQSVATDLQRLRDDVARSTALVENLLQLARLDPESADALVSDTIDTRALLEEVVRACAPEAAARNIAISVHCDVATLAGNRDALLTALRNLVHNSISYGRVGGRVEITAKRAGDTVTLAVRDDGDGVSDADRQRLTQRFFRVLGSGVQGSGLGLSIVARVAELHHADLQFGPGLDGRGLGVVLAFPLKSPR